MDIIQDNTRTEFCKKLCSSSSGGICCTAYHCCGNLCISIGFVTIFFSKLTRNLHNVCRLDDNPFCRKPEAAGICKTVQAQLFPNFVPQQYCAPLSCFLDLERGPDCSRPYLGSLVFRSFNFSDLANPFYYNFLVQSLQPLLANVSMPVDEVCLVSSSIDMYSYLVLNIAFFPPDGAYFNRTGISTIGHVLNNQFLVSPYGPYYFVDLTYPSFPGDYMLYLK